MKSSAAMSRMDAGVFDVFGHDVEIFHVAGGTTECKMIIDKDARETAGGFDGVEQVITADVLGSLRISDACRVAKGDLIDVFDEEGGLLERYRAGVLFPVVDAIVSVEMHQEAGA